MPPASAHKTKPGFIRLLAKAGRAALQVADFFAPLCRGWRWLPASVLVGVLPFLVSFAFAIQGHQFISAVLLAGMCMACARTDQWKSGIAAIAVCFSAHSITVISVARAEPERAARVLPGADEYWQKQKTWITTGQDPEYELKNWVPAHFGIFFSSTMLSSTSFGTLTFYNGFQQVDLMNYYNAQLMGNSVSHTRSLALGWHIWSILRGLGYLFLTFEIISLVLQLLSQKQLSTWRLRRFRWLMGLGLIVLDGVVKFMMVEVVRSQLFQNYR